MTDIIFSIIVLAVFLYFLRPPRRPIATVAM